MAIAWLRYLVGVHGCCLKEGKWAAEEWEERVERKESGSNLGGLKLTPHDFRPIKNKMGAYFCVHCRMHATESSVQRAMRLPCVPFLGEGAEQHTHPSHRIMRVSEVPHIYWCDRCGGLSCKQTFLLKGVCKPPSRWGKYSLTSLRGGFLPKTIFTAEKLWVGFSELASPEPSFASMPGPYLFPGMRESFEVDGMEWVNSQGDLGGSIPPWENRTEDAWVESGTGRLGSANVLRRPAGGLGEVGRMGRT